MSFVSEQIGNGVSIISSQGLGITGSVARNGEIRDTNFSYTGFIDSQGNVRGQDFRVMGFLDGRGNICGENGISSFVVQRL